MSTVKRMLEEQEQEEKCSDCERTAKELGEGETLESVECLRCADTFWTCSLCERTSCSYCDHIMTMAD
jgi:hypothetical protein